MENRIFIMRLCSHALGTKRSGANLTLLIVFLILGRFQANSFKLLIAEMEKAVSHFANFVSVMIPGFGGDCSHTNSSSTYSDLQYSERSNSFRL